MAARAIWKGQLKIGPAKIPVKLFSAATDKAVRFHLLDDKSLMRVKQHMVNPDTGEEVSTEELQKGYEIEPGTFVILTDEELESLEPEPSRDIEVNEFVSPDQISQQWYERPYYLAPDGDQKDYFALAQALENREVEGIAHWNMRNKAYIGALRALDSYLFLVTLRTASEVISAQELPKPSGREPSQKELQMARQLISAMEGHFDASEYKDEYRERLMTFIESKAKGHKPRLSPAKKKRASTSLDSVLARSIAALKKGKKAA